MTRLEPCPHCHRHVKVGEASCPFCTRSLAWPMAIRAPRSAPTARLGRAATFAFGVIAMSQGACSDDATPAQDAATVPTDAAPDAATPHDADYDGGEIPIYSAAPTRPGAGTTSRG